ncbi:MAG TPA: outer membrane protein assembly factor BamC [Casimicrobiaceae bacterium]|nr:outer membrane protein assembly factor BamC [Casimicrobiaceae bacterium]
MPQLFAPSLPRRGPGFVCTLAAFSLALTLAGCESMTFSVGKKIDYKSASSAPPLEVPPDLTTPAYDDRYAAQTASAAAAAKATGKSSEVLPINTEARLMRAGSERWLVVKTDPDTAWKTLRDFWTQTGFAIAVEQPALGIMETDWAENRADAPQTWLQQYSSKYLDFLTDTYRRDKFRTRIERGSEAGTVEIYVTHYGAAQLPTKTKQASPEDWVWQPTPPNPELEAEFLSRIMVRFGAPTQVANAAVAVAPAAPRARIERGSDGTTRLVVDDAFDRAWRRVGLALDRTGFTVVDRDRSQGLYYVRYANPDLEASKQKGWLDKLAFWKKDDKEKPEQYRVVVTQADPNSVVTVQDPKGATDKSPNSDKILALLQDQLK